MWGFFLGKAKNAQRSQDNVEQFVRKANNEQCDTFFFFLSVLGLPGPWLIEKPPAKTKDSKQQTSYCFMAQKQIEAESKIKSIRKCKSERRVGSKILSNAKVDNQKGHAKTAADQSCPTTPIPKNPAYTSKSHFCTTCLSSIYFVACQLAMWSMRSSSLFLGFFVWMKFVLLEVFLFELPLHLRISLIYFLDLCVCGNLQGAKVQCWKDYIVFVPNCWNCSFALLNFLIVLGFGSVWLWKSAGGTENREWKGESWEWGVRRGWSSRGGFVCEWAAMQVSDSPWNRCFYTFTGFLLDGFIICGGRVGFLNLIVKMLLVSAARLSFEGIKGAHVVQSQAPKTGSQNMRVSGLIWR